MWQSAAALAFAALWACASGVAEDPLLAKAEEQGRVRVIATLDVAPLPAGREPDPGELATHKRAIEKRRKALETRLAGYDCHFEPGPSYTPIAVLEVDSAALRALREAPEVVAVEEDRHEAPSR